MKSKRLQQKSFLLVLIWNFFQVFFYDFSLANICRNSKITLTQWRDSFGDTLPEDNFILTPVILRSKTEFKTPSFLPRVQAYFLLPWRQPGLNESPWNGRLNWKLDLTPGPPKYGYKILYIFYTINCPNDHLLILNTNSNTEIFRTSTLFHGRLRSSSNLLLIAWFEMFFDLIFYWNYPVYSFLFNRY